LRQAAEVCASVELTTGKGEDDVRPLSIAAGVFWALLTVVIWSAWPSYTRLGVISTFSAPDLVALRYAVGGLVLLPILIKQARHISPRGWREGFILAFFQGVPLALLVTLGVEFAPASHMAALSPGLLPLFSAIIALLFFKERISSVRAFGLMLIVAGALVLGGVSALTFSSGIWRGDLLFLCTGLMGSIYAVRMRRSGFSAMQGAAMIGVYSMMIYLPLYYLFWFRSGGFMEAPIRELLLQTFYQGVLMGALSLFSLSRAIIILGATRATAFISLVPVLGTVLGVVILREIPTLAEALAIVSISVGVLFATELFSARLQQRGSQAMILTNKKAS
jgi:drug/metabolite transporter (DMT)-like permease